ncbi:MAG: PD-(D/E)XK nuclease family protein [Proteobacteria bacterium]|nr:PD-(D/E)XK nuclease family protein [Pseudomonadota bacterium]
MLNIFQILDLPNHERPHDKVLAWLLDPEGGHNVPSLAADLIRRLWGVELPAGKARVTRQISLPGGLRPDIWVELDGAALMIENKVNPAALRPGQIAEQNAAARTILKGRRLCHLLIRPDRVRSDGLVIEDESFRELTYGQLAEVLCNLAQPSSESTGRALAIQFADYVKDRFGQPTPAGIRLASGTTVARRYSGTGWSEDDFLEHAEKTCDPEVMRRQRQLLDLLRSMDSVRVKFDAKGPTNPTYKVYFGDSEVRILWVYADGRLYVDWELLESAAQSEWKRLWGGSVNAQNKNNSFAKGGLTAYLVEDVAQKLQAIADFAVSKGTVEV